MRKQSQVNTCHWQNHQNRNEKHFTGLWFDGTLSLKSCCQTHLMIYMFDALRPQRLCLFLVLFCCCCYGVGMRGMRTWYCVGHWSKVWIMHTAGLAALVGGQLCISDYHNQLCNREQFIAYIYGILLCSQLPIWNTTVLVAYTPECYHNKIHLDKATMNDNSCLYRNNPVCI